jgi:hypothetical protein
MPIGKAIKEYGRLMRDVFAEKKLSISTSGSALYKAKKLQQALGVMIKEATGNEEEMMIEKEEHDGKSKTWVRIKLYSQHF